MIEFERGQSLEAHFDVYHSDLDFNPALTVFRELAEEAVDAAWEKNRT